LIASRWTPSAPTFDTTQAKEDSKLQASITPQTGDSSIAPDFVKDSIEEPKPQSDSERLRSTDLGGSSAPSPKSQENPLSYPPIRDLDDQSNAKVEEARAEVPLDQDQDLTQTEHTADIHEVCHLSLSPRVSANSHLIFTFSATDCRARGDRLITRMGFVIEA
jgi:hypothetical protein